MKPVLKEILILVVCLIFGYAISKFILTSIRGSEYNSTSIEGKQNENSISK